MSSRSGKPGPTPGREEPVGFTPHGDELPVRPDRRRHPDPTGAVVASSHPQRDRQPVGHRPHGLQTINWFPHDGRPNLTFEAHVSAPVLGANVQGKGCKVGIVITIPDPSAMAVIP